MSLAAGDDAAPARRRERRRMATAVATSAVQRRRATPSWLPLVAARPWRVVTTIMPAVTWRRDGAASMAWAAAIFRVVRMGMPACGGAYSLLFCVMGGCC